MTDFSFADHQVAFRDAVRVLLGERCTPSDVRAAWESKSGVSRARWKELADMGVTGMLVPESASGLSLGEVDLVLVLEEAGEALLPEPLIETSAIAPRVLDALDGLDGEWLERVATGDTLVTVGIGGPIVSADVADLLLVWDRDLYVLPGTAAHRTPRRTHDRGRRLFDVNWDRSRISPVLTGGAAKDLRAMAFERGAWAASAQLIGVAQRLLDLASAHAKERVQFERPIGSFQSVKHLLADVVIAVEFARPAVYAAAWSLEHNNETAPVDVSLAKTLASEAALTAGEVSLQIHGAIGYTWEYDLHMWLKRARSLAHAWGDAPFHRERIGAHLDI